MINQNVHNSLYPQSVFLLLFSIMTCTLSCKEPDYTKWEISIAYVDKMWEFDGSEVGYEFRAKNRIYRNSSQVPPGTIYGDRFIVLYNPENPSQSILACNTPLFISDERIKYTEGEITTRNNITPSIYKDKKSFYFSYKYYVDGKQYTRTQNTYFCKDVSPTCLKNGMKFKVKYTTNNPQSSLMMLDEDNMYTFSKIPCELQDQTMSIIIDSLNRKY